MRRLDMLMAIKRAANKLGVEIRKVPKGESEYELVFPAATYSPWNRNAPFQEGYRAIRDYTLVDQYRCYELWQLVEQSAKLKAGSIIEIGVWRGGTGALMALQAQRCSIKETVYLCDTFSGVVKAGEKDTAYTGGEHSDTSKQTVDRLAAQLKLDNVQILQGIFPDQTGHEVASLQFRLCHIDVDVYQSAKDIVEWIWDRMVPGGILVYDDFGFDGCIGVTRLVEEQMQLPDRLTFHNLNGHAVVVKLR